ncbi:hypothetical protein tinsulaeT_23860 [Thalassotalea insulae]|uniref:OmpR/PhoB-type domain-containing protein n=1 Tax=Thalassotalea insulae TaxID=2056778 RepID=A0ABQ6GSX9_9GAMM|nr:winged helix-turn-helix domain-containing protein [Thalassotalea insulae]GLX79046.1 hypothetical protein tinsulaeT_23860 [Thalassotalea insulae]
MEAFKLGNWQVFPKLNQLTLISSGKTKTVTPKIMQLLTALIEQGDNPASVDQLITNVWRDRVVADSSVYQAVAQLRKVLAADETIAVYIERISGQGYRICPDVDVSPFTPEKDKSKQARFILLVLVFLLAITGIFFTSQSNENVQSQHFESLSLASHLIKQIEPEQLHHAKQLYLEVLREDQDNVKALNGLCNSYRLLTIYDTLSETERDSLCRPLLEKAHANESNNPNVLASLAWQSFQQGDIKQSESLFQQALAITEQEAIIWHWYGQLKRSQNDIPAALTAHKKAFKLAPNDPIVLRGLAYAYLNNRDLNSARKYFERSIVIAPNFKNRPLYELDFYPLNQDRAKNYLAWYQQYEDSYFKRFPMHRLSYVIFLLSLNQAELATEELHKVEALDNIPQHFLLYAKASLAWHMQRREETLALLKQRYLLAPQQNHLVMPYLVALLHFDQEAQALTLFEQHFANIIKLETITPDQLGQYLLLTSLYQSLGKEQAYQQAFSKLLSLRQEVNKFPAQHELVWYQLTNKKEQSLELLTQMLTDGWLPDYNDSIFSITFYQSLLESDREKQQWRKYLSQKQNCIWQQSKCADND